MTERYTVWARYDVNADSLEEAETLIRESKNVNLLDSSATWDMLESFGDHGVSVVVVVDPELDKVLERRGSVPAP